jgi:hypothetical protein
MTGSTFSSAEVADVAGLVKAVERLLGAAMLASDGAMLKTVVADDLSDDHSSGLLEDRNTFIKALNRINTV